MKVNEEADLEIRPATPDDFDILTDINRICFPDQLRWKTFKSHNRKWWDILINSEYCEILVCTIFEQVIGYVVLVFDRLKYEDAWEAHRLGFGDIFYIIATCPIKSLKKTWAKYQRESENKLQKSVKQSKENQELSAYDKIRKCFVKNNPWLGPIAVLPSLHGRGIATDILVYCFQRLKMLGYNSVYSIVKLNNMQSRGLFEKLGFAVIDEVEYVVFYKKDLDKT